MLTETRQEQAKHLRYKKAMVADLNFEAIQHRFEDIREACDNAEYLMQYSDTLLDLLDGDEEEAYEFRMLYSDLAGECEQLQELLYGYDSTLDETFDNFMVGIVTRGNGVQILGYDTFENDYYSLFSYQEDWAQDEAVKRLMRNTKEGIIDIARQCFRLLIVYFTVEKKFDYLNASFDILQDDRTRFIQQVKDIDAAYTAAEEAGWHGAEARRFDRMLEGLDEKMWVE